MKAQAVGAAIWGKAVLGSWMLDKDALTERTKEVGAG